VLGSWAFRRLDVLVDPRVLVPRPETEQLVEFALDELRRHADVAEIADVADVAGDRTPADALLPVVVADLGTGSGVIALSIALEANFWRAHPLEVWATDSSADALEVALANLNRLSRFEPRAAARVHFSQGSWFEALPAHLAGGVQLVVSNPPYISESDWRDLDPVVRNHEPRPALVAGETGREMLELLVSGSLRWLSPGGSLVLELAPEQARPVARAAAEAGFVDVEVRRDLSGRSRAVVARRPDG
jgi:release factor glutamine methyltransferase